MPNHRTPQAVEDCHQLLLWIIPLLDQFPRQRRFTLGERLEGGLLNLLQYLVEASYTQRKRGLLAQANSQLDVVRHLWRLAFELETIPARRYQHGARLMEALGQQIGGWKKSQTDAS